MEYMYYSNNVGDDCRVYNMHENGLKRDYDYSVEVNNTFELRFKSIIELDTFLCGNGYSFMGFDND